MSVPLIETLFASKIRRRIEEVIKVDQTDEDILRDEIDEYVVTDAIRRHYTGILDLYQETPNKPHEGTAVWVSGFFGSGKSSFAKMLGLAIANKQVKGESAARRFAQRAGDPKLQVFLSTINEKIPTHAVIFDVSTDRGIKSGNQMLTEIMYRLFLQSLGYARDLDLAELEIALEGAGRLEAFKAEYARLFSKDWDVEKGKVVFALSQASRVMHSLEPETYPLADSWVKAVKDKADINPGLLAERCLELLKRRKPGHQLLFVVDEVGQFVARDVSKMLDLQAVVQSFGRVGRGREWIVITSQEKLGELVSGLDSSKIELARLMDRFPLQVHLEPSDISEVTSRRVLTKNAPAEDLLRKLFTDHRGQLTEHTRVSAEVRLPELTAEGFIDLYPLLPYQVELIVYVVSGLRMQGGASKHVGGANRTIIKLAQQLLINPAVDLAAQPLGRLVTLDQVYDLVEGNIASEVRAKIAAIPREVGAGPGPFAQKVAKAICLLQYVKNVPRSVENLSAVLHPAVDAHSQLPAVREALAALVATHQVRLGDDGYRIPTPAEDDWERTRAGVRAREGDVNRIHSEVMESFWQPPPSHTMLDTKTFRAGLTFNGRSLVEGDMAVHLFAEQRGRDFDARVAELRGRSQLEIRSLFWVVPLDGAIGHETEELHRSKEMLARKEREKTADAALIAEERVRQRRHQDELKRLLRLACLRGTVFFRGNDRSPDERATDVGRTTSELLGEVLPEVFDRFHEAAARVQRRDLDALLVSDSLQGLPPVFSALSLLRAEGGKPVFRLDSGPLKEVLGRIENRANYGETASGKYLAEELAKEPFGWDFEVVRLLVLSLLRAGKIEVTSRGTTLDSALSVEARDVFLNNNVFRQAAFRPRVGLEFAHIVQAAEAFASVFGKEAKELEQGLVAQAIRDELARAEEDVQAAFTLLVKHRLPGQRMLDDALAQMRDIRRGSETHTLLAFNGAFRPIKEAIRRAAELRGALTEPRLKDLERAQEALRTAWAFLQLEPDLDDALRGQAGALRDLLERETFFRELPSVDQHARELLREYARRHEEALLQRTEAYRRAYAQLTAMPEWASLGEERQQRVALALSSRMRPEEGASLPIPQLRADRDACPARLAAAVEELLRMLDGDRVVTVRLGSFFVGGLETEEQLDAALEALREECARHIGAGRKVLLQ
jgi:hypothetical protein